MRERVTACCNRTEEDEKRSTDEESPTGAIEFMTNNDNSASATTTATTTTITTTAAAAAAGEDNINMISRDRRKITWSRSRQATILDFDSQGHLLELYWTPFRVCNLIGLT